MSVPRHLILVRRFTPGTRLLSVFFWSLCCLSFLDLLHLMTPLVSSNFSNMILAHFIVMLFVAKYVFLHVSMICYRRLLHMIYWCDKMITKYPTLGTVQNPIKTIIIRRTTVARWMPQWSRKWLPSPRTRVNHVLRFVLLNF